MKGKHPVGVSRLRAEILSDDRQRTQYFEQRLISELGGVIDQVLKERRLTQTKLAEAVQMHQPDLNALVRGRAEHLPTIPTLRRLAAGLGVGFSIRIEPDGTVQLTQLDAARAKSDTYPGSHGAAR
jgi:predicted XRE-type DNA-binding protein